MTGATEGGGQLWVRLCSRHRVLRDVVVPCTRDGARDALLEACRLLDLSRPLWLNRHDADWASFGLTRFLPEHFVDSVPFEYMEVSYVAPEDDKKKRRLRGDA